MVIQYLKNWFLCGVLIGASITYLPYGALHALQPKDPAQAFALLMQNKQFYDAYDFMQHKNINLFLPILLNHFTGLGDSYYGKNILDYTLKNLPAARMLLAKKAVQEIKKTSVATLCSIAKYDAVIIDNALVELVNNGDANDIIKGIQYTDAMNKKLPFKLTPTGLHLSKNSWVVTSYLVRQFVEDPELLDLLNAIIAKERALAAQNYYTFVHGQRRGYYLPERMYTFLWQLKNNKIYNNFMFAHVKSMLTDAQLLEEENLRQYILVHGRKPKDPVTRQMLLFLNYAFFAQINDHGSNSAQFVLQNQNWGSVPISIKTRDAFVFLGYESLYEKYRTEIEELEEAYKKGKSGNVLMVAVPKDGIKNLVYLCQAGQGPSGMGGVKKSVYIDGIGKTDDIAVIMEQVLKHPEKLATIDDLEFCLIMTQQKGGLDPKTGIQIHPILSGDQKIIAELQLKESQLCARIAADIQKIQNITAEVI